MTHHSEDESEIDQILNVSNEFLFELVQEHKRSCVDCLIFEAEQVIAEQ